jgi:hypothetical protein
VFSRGRRCLFETMQDRHDLGLSRQGLVFQKGDVTSDLGRAELPQHHAPIVPNALYDELGSPRRGPSSCQATAEMPACSSLPWRHLPARPNRPCYSLYLNPLRDEPIYRRSACKRKSGSFDTPVGGRALGLMPTRHLRYPTGNSGDRRDPRGFAATQPEVGSLQLNASDARNCFRVSDVLCQRQRRLRDLAANAV